MVKSVEWAKSARADLKRLDPKTQVRIFSAVERLATTQHGDVKKLQGAENLYRLRVGSWRVRFTRDPATGAMVVLRILPRASAYRN